jgi:hypothetical protein
MAYTTNLNPNPNFSLATTAGYTALNGSAIAIDDTQSMFLSLYSMQVVTDGLNIGEGFYSPAGTIIPGNTCSVSLYLQGETGTVTVSAVSNPGGVLLQSANIQLQSVFTRVTLSGFTVGDGNTLYIVVATPTAQDLTFNVAGVQIEPDSPSTPYCDGDQPACFWEGTPGASISFRPVEYGTSGSLQVTLSGAATAYIPGGIFDTGEALATVTLGGTATPAAFSPPAAMDDFAIYTSSDADPAMTYCYGSNAGAALNTSTYVRGFGAFVPPLDYPVSGGEYAWNRAAFAGFGFSFAGVPQSNGVSLTNAQVEITELDGADAVAPSAWDMPRALHVTVDPDMLNYVTNPSFETSTQFWSGIGNVTLSQDTAKSAGNISVLESVEYNAGTASMKVTLNDATGLGTQITITELIPGRTYTASFWVQPGADINDITGSASGSGGDLQDTGEPYGGSAITGTGYGDGYYGGIAPATQALPTGIWTQVVFNFVAGTDTITLQIEAVPITSATYPVEFWVDAIMVNPGDTLAQYFDGSFGEDCFWEGTENLSRSYYYSDYDVKQRIVSDVLDTHTPYGITYETPVFNSPPTQ